MARQQEHTRYIQRALNEMRSRAVERLATMDCYIWPKPKLKIDLNTGNIFRDAFPFLFSFRYEYPEMPKGKDTIRIRKPMEFNLVRKPDMIDIHLASFGKGEVRATTSEISLGGYDVRVAVPDHNKPDTDFVEACKQVFGVAEACSVPLGVPSGKPLFSTRREIASKCEEWCKDKDIPVEPLNIITAAFKLGLVKR